MAGRNPLGPELVWHLEGSGEAQERLKTILETITGDLPIRDAGSRLGIKDAMFYRMRMRVLQAALTALEPRPRGRRPKASARTEREWDKLTARVAELERKLQLAQAQCEAALIAPEWVAERVKKMPPPRRRPR